jgi:LacI family transcriptional regulator
MAAEHLLERKLKNFGYCGFNGVYWSNDRGKAFADALAEAGHKTDYYRQPRKSKLPTWENELPHIVAWLASLPKPVGIMACCDDLGQHVIEACNVGRLGVPHEVAVIAVDNDELLCEMTFPPLSSITVNFEKVGFEAAVLLDKLMSGRAKSPKTLFMEPTGVVTRQSTDTLAIEDKTVLRAIRLIRERRREPTKVTDIARELAMSNRTLDRKFRTFLGRSVHSEIVRMRIEKACQLLLDTNMAISNIASHLGYSELGHMSRAFKKAFGTSPLEYRKKFRATSSTRSTSGISSC